MPRKIYYIRGKPLVIPVTSVVTTHRKRHIITFNDLDGKTHVIPLSPHNYKRFMEISEKTLPFLVFSEDNRKWNIVEPNEEVVASFVGWLEKKETIDPKPLPYHTKITPLDTRVLTANKNKTIYLIKTGTKRKGTTIKVDPGIQTETPFADARTTAGYTIKIKNSNQKQHVIAYKTSPETTVVSNTIILVFGELAGGRPETKLGIIIDSKQMPGLYAMIKHIL